MSLLSARTQQTLPGKAELGWSPKYPTSRECIAFQRRLKGGPIRAAVCDESRTWLQDKLPEHNLRGSIMKSFTITAIAARATTPSKRRPPCAARPDDWDLDIGTPAIWQEAVRICHGCPVLAQCRELAETLIARGMPPRSLIWAGVGYDRSGHVIENLDLHRVRPIVRKRPLRIVRTGRVFVRFAGQRQPNSDLGSTPLRRTIILRRRRLPPPPGTQSG
jgi:hypothetical protein